MYTHIVQPGETLYTIANDFRIDLTTLLTANQLHPSSQLLIGQTIDIPTLPDPQSISYSIHVSLNQHTLSLYHNGQLVQQYPIAVGKMLTQTPTGTYVIINKAPNPGGPFGVMWMSLSKQHYGIHGTNDPSSIGRSVSHGCIRMYNQDVTQLAATIPIGTPVTISP
ncbi:L,D-transpeptidase family protein [Shouchella lehensis]|uniref:L,D-transpeptidase YkuD n=1 Tax=Shouchella lehensis G1 TaxID=1246626 RepID=A0A060M5T2_9BACI|nr:L,D-transpeptidase family protein [Shouchella lehensis]AIC95908.1 L,D-transpeptidase YkuD [Shouchella lehensis G1]RQW18560.1 LysM peptidoglycan-binding domain-containing protein [Bacillus sp. C1-1]